MSRKTTKKRIWFIKGHAKLNRNIFICSQLNIILNSLQSDSISVYMHKAYIYFKNWALLLKVNGSINEIEVKKRCDDNSK